MCDKIRFLTAAAFTCYGAYLAIISFAGYANAQAISTISPVKDSIIGNSTSILSADNVGNPERNGTVRLNFKELSAVITALNRLRHAPKLPRHPVQPDQPEERMFLGRLFGSRSFSNSFGPFSSGFQPSSFGNPFTRFGRGFNQQGLFGNSFGRFGNGFQSPFASGFGGQFFPASRSSVNSYSYAYATSNGAVGTRGASPIIPGGFNGFNPSAAPNVMSWLRGIRN